MESVRAKVIGTDWCPYCNDVVNMLEKAGVKYEFIDSDEKPEIRAKYKAELKYGTIPMVWVDGKFIGGASDFKAKVRNGSIKL